MTADRGVAAMLFDACLTAGVDPEVAFEHLDDMDVAEYGRALREGWFPVGHRAEAVEGGMELDGRHRRNVWRIAPEGG